MSEKCKVLYVQHTTDEARVVVFPEENRISIEVLKKDSLGNESWNDVFGDSMKINILKKALWKQVMDDGN